MNEALHLYIALKSEGGGQGGMYTRHTVPKHNHTNFNITVVSTTSFCTVKQDFVGKKRTTVSVTEHFTHALNINMFAV